MRGLGKAIYFKAVAMADRLLERLVAFRPNPRNSERWLSLIALSLLLAFAIRVHFGQVLSVDLFLVPVLLSAALFRNRGLPVVPVAALAYYLGGLLCRDIDNRHLLLNTLGQVVEWGLLAGFALVTLDRYGAIQRLQRRMNQDLELARRLQSALMQNQFELGSIRICGRVSQTLEVGGDFFYFRPFGQKYVVFCLGDVMGKGVAASLLMSLVMGFMFEWGKKSPSPSFVLRKLNQRLTRWNGEQSRFVTLFYAVYDEEEGVLHYANAGHPPALLIQRDGGVSELTGTGLPLGIFEDGEWEERHLNIAEGERLAVFSDGLLEAKDPQGRDFGLEPLLVGLRQARGMSLEETVESLENQVRRHSRGRLSDDLAILLIERTASA